MNKTTDTPIFSSAGTSNRIGFEWGTSNPTLSLVKSAIANNEMTYHIPRDSGIKPSSIFFDEIVVGTVALAYWGGVLGPNGRLYCIPYNATQVLEVDLLAKTTNAFGTLNGPATSAKWAGGVLAPDGKIYCAPRIATWVLEIDPIKKTTVEYAHVGGTYNGAVLADNGKVYFIPYTTTTGDVMEFDPITKQMTTFGNVGTTLFNGGVLAPNGKIYCIPYSADLFGIIDPDNRTIRTVTSAASSASNSRYSGGVLAPNGKIYCVPFNGSEVLVIDPLSDTSYEFGNLSTSTGKWAGGFLGSDGYIYCVPDDARNGTTGICQVLKINWFLDTLEIIEIPNSIVAAGQSSSFQGALMTPYGFGVGVPSSNDGVLILNLNLGINDNIALSNVFNKY